MLSLLGQSRGELAAQFGAVQRGEILRVGFASDDLEHHEYRPLLLQYCADPFTELGKVRELVDAAIARGAREAGEADATGARDGVAPLAS